MRPKLYIIRYKNYVMTRCATDKRYNTKAAIEGEYGKDGLIEAARGLLRGLGLPTVMHTIHYLEMFDGGAK